VLPRSDHGELLQLPLIDRYRSAPDAIQKLGVGYALAQHVRELPRTRAFRTGCHQQNRPARLHHMGSRGDAFDGLVKRKIERVSGSGGDRGIYRFIQHFEQHLGHEIDSAAVREPGMSGEYTGDRPIARQGNVQHEIMPRQARNFQQFPMQLVVFDRAFYGARIPHEFRTMQHPDGFLSSQTRSDQLPSARIAEHEMRLDETEGDVQIGAREPLVDIHRRARLGGSEVAMGR